MPLHLVIHCPPSQDAAGEACRTALREAVWEVAESHWAPSDEAVLVSSDLSSDYLLSHFRRSLARRGFEDPGVLIVAATQRLATHGLPQEAQDWIAAAPQGEDA
jgi:transposase InsO family protein